MVRIMQYNYKPSGICPNNIEFDIKNGIVEGLRFNGGCNGNLKALSVLVAGMAVEDAISRLKGITCGSRSTSCPDQLAKALEDWVLTNS